MGNPRPGVPVSLNVRALLARDIVPMFIEVGLIDAELPYRARLDDVGCWTTGGGGLAESYLATALRRAIVAAGDVLDLGKRLGAPSRILAASGHRPGSYQSLVAHDTEGVRPRAIAKECAFGS